MFRDGFETGDLSRWSEPTCGCEGIGSGLRICSDGTTSTDTACAADNCLCAGEQGSPPSCTAYFGCTTGTVQVNYACSNPDDIAADAPGTCASSFCGCVGFDYVCGGITSSNDEYCITAAGCTCVGYTDSVPFNCSTGTGHFDCNVDGIADTDITNFYCENSCPRP